MVCFYFVTDETQIYEIGFVEDQMIAIENAYQLFLISKSGQNEFKDSKIQQTITAIIEEFFKTNDVLLDYICDTKDGRQAARSRFIYTVVPPIFQSPFVYSTDHFC